MLKLELDRLKKLSGGWQSEAYPDVEFGCSPLEFVGKNRAGYDQFRYTRTKLVPDEYQEKMVPETTVHFLQTYSQTPPTYSEYAIRVLCTTLMTGLGFGTGILIGKCIGKLV